MFMIDEFCLFEISKNGATRFVKVRPCFFGRLTHVLACKYNWFIAISLQVSMTIIYLPILWLMDTWFVSYVGYWQ